MGKRNFLRCIFGKIDVRETFALVEVAPAVVEQAVRRLGRGDESGAPGHGEGGSG